MMLPKPFQIPVALGQHMNPAIAANENRQTAILLTAKLCRVKDFFGITQKRTHDTLIATIEASVNWRFY